jgi:hypothetical protein
VSRSSARSIAKGSRRSCRHATVSTPTATSPHIVESPRRYCAVGDESVRASSEIGVEMTSVIQSEPAITRSRPSGESSS